MYFLILGVVVLALVFHDRGMVKDYKKDIERQKDEAIKDIKGIRN